KEPGSPKFKRLGDGRDPRFPFRVLLIWAIILIAIPVFLQFRKHQAEDIVEITYGELEARVEEGRVTTATVYVTAGALDRIKGEYVAADDQLPVKFEAMVAYDDEIRKFFKD
ncbi:MAG: hypothetical protein GTN90_04450, partial [Xanthomonadales bacterium]|nr:hypothetical protein [Xanthomonadales bacterium]